MIDAMTDAMIDTIRVFVNATAVDVPVGSDVRTAVQTFDPSLAERLTSDAVSVVDARGIVTPLDTRLSAGAILRVIVSARRPPADGVNG